MLSWNSRLIDVEFRDGTLKFLWRRAKLFVLAFLPLISALTVGLLAWWLGAGIHSFAWAAIPALYLKVRRLNQLALHFYDEMEKFNGLMWKARAELSALKGPEPPPPGWTPSVRVE